MRALIRTGYFSFEVEGAEHIPRHGPVVFAQNHAGWLALDAFFAALAIEEGAGLHRVPCFAAHDSLMALPILGPFCQSLGALPASFFRQPHKLPRDVDSFALFPEGVRGNCKPFWDAYRMRKWSRGFARLAIARQAAIVPVAVIGGEECLPVAWTVKALEPLVGSIVGAPLLPVPLPARWKVIFHAPVHVSGHGQGALADAIYCADLVRQVQATVQATLDRETARHPLARLSSFVEKLRRALGPVEPVRGPGLASGDARLEVSRRRSAPEKAKTATHR